MNWFRRYISNCSQVLELDNLTLLEQSNFNNTRPTKFYAHGLNGSPLSGYPTKNAQEDVNFIAVDWSAMATGNYNYVGTNYVPLAGLLMGQFVNFLVQHGASIDLFHLIGLSFGAHVVSNAGAVVTSGRVARITGLDPSHTDEFFLLEDLDSRLDTTDAQFVDIIHTEGRFTVPIGHIDFFPNGDITQPGCIDHGTTCCSHCRALDYYAESVVTEVGFRSIRCTSWNEYLAGICTNNESVLMGAYIPSTASGVFYLKTNAASPFAIG